MNRSIPKCFGSRRQFDLWREAAFRSTPGGSDYCTDCTAAYQQRMGRQGRCAYPDTTFAADGDGFIEGNRPVAERVRLREAA